jgi:protein-S-isoprenylcysteine O-methyltransferase Ste14
MGTFPLRLNVVYGWIWRLRDEEAFLTRNLPRYAEYARRVRYRLVPLVW